MSSHNYLGIPATEAKPKEAGVGTIKLTVLDRGMLQNCLSERMKTFLDENGVIQSDSEEFEEDKKLAIKTGYQEIVSGFYRACYVFVGSRPNAFINRIPDYCLTFHFSQWSSMQDFMGFLKMVCGTKDAETIFYQGMIARIDFWLDLGLTYDNCKLFISRPGITCVEKFRSDKRTFYFGAKGVKQGVMYEKPNPRIRKLDYIQKANPDPELLTRIEVRYFKKKVPISHLSEYGDSWKQEPFSMLKTYMTTKNDRKALKAKSRRLETFVDYLEGEGLHFARRKMNKLRDFYRTIEPHLKNNSKDLALDARWKKKVTSFMGSFDPVEFFAEEDSESFKISTNTVGFSELSVD